MSRAPRLVDVVLAEYAIDSRRGVALGDISGYLAETLGGERKRYHRVIKHAVDEGFLIKRGKRYYFNSDTKGKKEMRKFGVSQKKPQRPSRVERAHGIRRLPEINQLARRRRRAGSRARRSQRHARVAANKSTRRSRRRARVAAYKGTRRGVKGKRTVKDGGARRVRRHVCGSCSCGWLHPCVKSSGKKPSESSSPEGPGEVNIHIETEPEEPQAGPSSLGELLVQIENQPEELQAGQLSQD